MFSLATPGMCLMATESFGQAAAADPEDVLAIWQQVNGRELGGRQRTEFLGHPALDDLTAFTTDTLAGVGRRLHAEHGELLLSVWAAECTVLGICGLPPSGELRVSLIITGEVVRTLVAALANAIRCDDDRVVLERRFGLHGGAPQTLQQIGDDLGLSPELIWQHQERAIGQMRSAGVRPGHRSASGQARDRLAALVTDEDGTIDDSLIRAAAWLGFPGTAERDLAARVIAQVTGARPTCTD